MNQLNDSLIGYIKMLATAKRISTLTDASGRMMIDAAELYEAIRTHKPVALQGDAVTRLLALHEDADRCGQRTPDEWNQAYWKGKSDGFGQAVTIVKQAARPDTAMGVEPMPHTAYEPGLDGGLSLGISTPTNVARCEIRDKTAMFDAIYDHLHSLPERLKAKLSLDDYQTLIRNILDSATPFLRTTEPDEAYRYAVRLFKLLAPQCEPLTTTTGVLSQLDNYIAGLREPVSRSLEAVTQKYIEDTYGQENVSNAIREKSRGKVSAVLDAAGVKYVD